jgi:hypothetical protein
LRGYCVGLRFQRRRQGLQHLRIGLIGGNMLTKTGPGIVPGVIGAFMSCCTVIEITGIPA